MVVPLPSPATPHGAICRATRGAGPVFCATLRSSSLIWNDQTSLLAPCFAQKQAPARPRTKRQQTLAPARACNRAYSFQAGSGLMDFPVAFAHVLSRLENPMSDRITLLRPDDWHIHLRDGAALAHTVADAARQFARAIIMPNLVPPVRNAAEAHDYRQRIIDARPSGSRFEPLMVLYLTDGTSVEDVRAAKASGFVHAAKLYPAGATTNSASGVTKIDNIFHVLDAMAEVGLPLLVHGEVTRSEIDIFDREKHFID